MYSDDLGAVVSGLIRLFKAMLLVELFPRLV